MLFWLFHLAYRKIQYVGRENIPENGAVILTPNHTNAISDAFAVLTIDPVRKVFVARADIFKNKKLAWLLNGFKIMPIRRMRDGASAVLQNGETERAAIETLRDGIKFCILPEGRHRTMHSLLPLGKGAFRIALQANSEFGEERPVYLQPIGIEYGDYFRIWDSLTVNIGKPINVTEFVKEHPELDEQKTILALREELTERMKELILWVPDDENYAENFLKLQANPPAPHDKFKKHQRPKWLLLLFLILTFPLFLVSAVATLPMWLILLLIRKKIKDPAFHNSVQFLVQFVYFPITLFWQIPFWMFFQEYGYQYRKFRGIAPSIGPKKYND